MQDSQEIIRKFEDAVWLCKYEKATKLVDNDDLVLSAYEIEEQGNFVCNAMLLQEKDSISVIVTTPYYMHEFFLKDATTEIIAYLIRNATKSVDDYDASTLFFSDLFMNRMNLDECDDFLSIIFAAVDCKVSQAYVCPDMICMQKRGAKA